MEHYARIDHVLSAVEAGPIGAVRTGAELIWPHENAEFHTDWARRYGIGDGLFVRLTDRPLATSLCVAAVKRLDQFDSAERIALIRLLVSHLQQALQTQTHLEGLDQRSSDVVEASEAVRHGIVTVGSRSQVVYTNAAADGILCSADGLLIRNRRSEAAARPADTRLQCSITAALSPNGTPTRGDTLLCPRGSGRRPYLVHVLPLDQTADTSRRPQNRALIVIVDPEREPGPSDGLLRSLYRLTASESTIALLVSRGYSLNALAEELSLSLATVKTHLQHVFDKTDTHRQAELVRLVLSLGPLL